MPYFFLWYGNGNAANQSGAVEYGKIVEKLNLYWLILMLITKQWWSFLVPE